MNKIFLNVTLFVLISMCSQAQVSFLQQRDYLLLSDWKFKKGVIYNAEAREFDDTNWKNVSVPHTYSMDAINGVGYYRGIAWYRTNFSIPEKMKNQRLYVRFEGVGQEVVVYLNGHRIGKHIGGYSAFCFEITDFVDAQKENVLVAQVNNAPNFKRIPVDDALFNHYGGIYRPVQLFSTPACNISPTFYASPGVFVKTMSVKDDLAQMEVRAHISSRNAEEAVELSFIVRDAENAVIVRKNRAFTVKGETIISEVIDITDPIRWNGRKNPYLYQIDVELFHDGNTDIVSQNFGLRTFSVDAEKGFFLNGKPYRLYGVAMHQEWEQTGPALTEVQHRTDMALIDEIGATSLRCSHYQHSEITYRLADETGLAVWAEIPFVHDYSGREQGNAKQQLKELIFQNFNHPSIVFWGLWNEVRAWNSAHEPCVSLTKDLNQLAHQLDPSRITVSASDRGMESNMGNLTDLQAWNKYYGWYYGEYEDMASWLDDGREYYPEIALGISEYGIGGNIYQQDTAKLEKPSGNYFPEPEQSKYHEITWKIIKNRPFIWSSFVWNMFDFSVAGWNRGGIKNLNHKGLVTYDRKIKKDAFYFYKANWSSEPVLYIAGLRNDQRTKAQTNVKVFTNLKKVTLFLNGEKYGTKKQSGDMNTVIFDGILLKDGENTIKVLGEKHGETFTHEAQWELVKD